MLSLEISTEKNTKSPNLDYWRNLQKNQVKVEEIKFEEKDLLVNFNLSKMIDYLHSLKENDSITKLFTLSLDQDTIDTIDFTIKGRDCVSRKNNLPEYMARKNQTSIDVKSVGSEVPMSYLLRGLNKGSKCKLKTPELNTITPNKEKPDFEMSNTNVNILFDMKSQCRSNTININKIAHDRAVSQGLTFYLVGIVNDDTIEGLKEVTYYHLPLDYFLKHSKFVNDNQYCLMNHRNDYYAITIKDINKSVFELNKG